jgi:alpha-amylase
VSDAPLALCFGVHNHQPAGNFDRVLEEADERGYRPFLERIEARAEVRLTVHWTGSLLAWLREHAPATYDLLGALVARGQVELLTGGFYEPILAILPDADKIGQVERLSGFLKSEFGVRPRGMWLAERVWEPHLPRALREAGVEYVLVDDSHFALAGLDPEEIGGYYLTEDQGAVLGVFPINQRLRYLIPFAEVPDSVEYLERRRGRTASLTVADDGEKFGVWPGTFKHVYEDGWLDRFFDRIEATPWLAMTTLGDVLDRFPASGRVYLPAASYREMGEWALSPAAGIALEAAKRQVLTLPGGDRIQPLLRGGFWRGFLVKYPEVADVYWKMLRVSAAVHGALARAPDDARLLAAREALWRGQANDAYWHGVFGGCYLPHLRRAVKGALLEAERLLAEATAAPALTWWRRDGNGDGREEVFVATPALAVTLNPAMGGALTEIGYYPRHLDLADVLARREEAYHAQVRGDGGADAAVRTVQDVPAAKEAGLGDLLADDDLRRASLLDGLVAAEGELDPVAPWDGARFRSGDTACASRVDAAADRVTVALSPAGGEGAPGVDKRVSVGGRRIEARYRVDARGRPGRWIVQWNLALTAGDGPDRYLDLPERPALRSRGRVTGRESVTLVDEWLGLRATVRWSPGAELAWGPVETVSVSEAGFERIYQGTALLLAWPLPADGPREMTVALEVAG